MIVDFFIDLLFPRVCVSCKTGIKNGIACDECLAKIERHNTLFCGKCRARIPGIKKVCHNDFPYLLGAAGDYSDSELRDILHALKFAYMKDAAETVGKLIGDYALSLPKASLAQLLFFGHL